MASMADLFVEDGTVVSVIGYSESAYDAITRNTGGQAIRTFVRGKRYGRRWNM